MGSRFRVWSFALITQCHRICRPLSVFFHSCTPHPHKRQIGLNKDTFACFHAYRMRQDTHHVCRGGVLLLRYHPPAMRELPGNFKVAWPAAASAPIDYMSRMCARKEEEGFRHEAVCTRSEHAFYRVPYASVPDSAEMPCHMLTVYGLCLLLHGSPRARRDCFAGFRTDVR